MINQKLKLENKAIYNRIKKYEILRDKSYEGLCKTGTLVACIPEWVGRGEYKPVQGNF